MTRDRDFERKEGRRLSHTSRVILRDFDYTIDPETDRQRSYAMQNSTKHKKVLREWVTVLRCVDRLR